MVVYIAYEDIQPSDVLEVVCDKVRKWFGASRGHHQHLGFIFLIAATLPVMSLQIPLCWDLPWVCNALTRQNWGISVLAVSSWSAGALQSKKPVERFKPLRLGNVHTL